jgi:protein-disulfide isomerase
MIVGGAQRKNRRQKQRQSASAVRAVSAARGRNTGMFKIVVPLVVVVVIAAAVVGGLLYEKHKSDAAAQTVIPALTVPGSTGYPTTLDKANATVLVGKPTAKITVDAYEDFLCPICQEFESANFTDIEKQLQAGTVKVRYHMINLLDSHSVPAGYSMLAANTALAVATAAPDKFMDFHYSLYQKQPAENGPGWTQAQLTSLADRLGVSGGAFQSVVDNKTYDNQINTNLNAASNNQSLFQTNSDGSRGFGTPTIVANGKVVNWQATPTWLSDLVKSTYPAS